MTGRLPALKPQDVLRALQRAGFVVVRVKGSHHILVHKDDATRMTNVPRHGSRDLPRGTLRAIISQSGLTVDEFIDLL
jgi:predicted RNA binding protein YcfA (HicA-like mRNA interferase family)